MKKIPIQDDERLREERKKAKKNKDKYVGMSSDSMGFRQAQFQVLKGIVSRVRAGSCRYSMKI